MFTCYTDWPADTNAELWLVNNGEDFLLAESVKMLMPRMRAEPQLVNYYKELSKEGLQTLLLAEEELDRENDDNPIMRYGRDYTQALTATGT